MSLELKRLDNLKASELGQVTTPFYAVGRLKSARAGYLRIRGFHEAWESCTDRDGPWDWNYREHGFERLCAEVERGDWVLVLDKSWPPISPAFQQVNGQWEVTRQVWPTTPQHRFAVRARTLERERREGEALQSRNLPSSAAPETEPAVGPGNRAASLGPHAGGRVAPKKSASDSTSTSADYSGAQQAQIEQALKDQHIMLEAKKAELATWDEPAKANFQRAFGTTDESARQLMQQRIDAMLNLNKIMTMANFQPAEPDQLKLFGPGLFAYVRPNDPSHTIYLGPKFWTAPDTGLDSKAGTLAHEMSHFSDVGGTRDNFPAQGYRQPVYGVSASRQLAQKDSDLALRHADSFQYYLEDAK